MQRLKCSSCQENLAKISQLRDRGVAVLCRVKAEPDNPFDSKPIAFECQIHGEWHIIGYAVREALDELHEDSSCGGEVPPEFAVGKRVCGECIPALSCVLICMPCVCCYRWYYGELTFNGLLVVLHTHFLPHPKLWRHLSQRKTLVAKR